MVLVYEAIDAIEAHMIQDLLQRSRISSRIDGEVLQGGIGEIQTMGLVKVLVEPDDYAAARDEINSWEKSVQHLTTESKDTEPFSMMTFMSGIILGVFLATLFFVA